MVYAFFSFNIVMASRIKTTSIPLKIISLDQQGFHLMLKVRINNRVARLILDTGASKTVFDFRKIKKYVKTSLKKNDQLSTGLGTNEMVTHTVSIKKLDLGTLTIHDFSMVLLDLKHISQSYALLGLPAIDGVLGGDILMEYHAVIDYQKRRLHLKIKSK